MPVQGEKYYKNYGIFFVFLLLLTANILFFYLIKQSSHRGLTFAMLNIGQGDGIFIQSPTGTQLLIDAGPPKKVLGQLARVMPLFDRHIDGIIITNPDQDHIGGFQDVLKAYKVDQAFEPGTFNDSKTYQNLKAEIKNKNIKNILARRGTRLDLGGGAVIDILFPDRDVADWTSNDGSIVAKLSYGKTSIMLTGDATAQTEGIILFENNVETLKSKIIKIG
ncbi:MAG: MBL fold metallo-hydrolase, partial [Candidatus Paceibacterota bacterium]